METTGVMVGLSGMRNNATVTLSIDARPEDLEKYLTSYGQDEKQLDVKIVRHRDHRSLDANAFLWSLLGQMAEKLNTDNWDLYLYELKRYGVFTEIRCRKDALKRLQETWRETKVVGEGKDPDGTEWVDVLCFFGSSTYNTQEFSRLLDGVISDMKDMGMEIPPDEKTVAILNELQRREAEKNAQ